MKNTITVVGVGHASRMPDRASFVAVVRRDATDPDEAYAAAVAGLAAVVDALKAAGAAESDLTTAGASVWEYRVPLWLLADEDDEEKREKKRAPQYGARGEVRVETDDIEHASELARAAVRAGASEATSIRFALSDWSGMVTEALTMAANCAWESAEALAMASERTLGQVVSATTRLESQRGSLQGPIWHFERSPEQSAESAPVIPSPLEVEQRVEMVFELL